MGIKEKEKSLKKKCFQETRYLILYMEHFISKLNMVGVHHIISIRSRSKNY